MVCLMLVLSPSARAEGGVRLEYCSPSSPHDQGPPKNILKQEWNRNDEGESFGPIHHGLEGFFLPGNPKRNARIICAYPDRP